jgi:hypothetical protein
MHMSQGPWSLDPRPMEVRYAQYTSHVSGPPVSSPMLSSEISAGSGSGGATDPEVTPRDGRKGHKATSVSACVDGGKPRGFGWYAVAIDKMTLMVRHSRSAATCAAPKRDVRWAYPPSPLWTPAFICSTRSSGVYNERVSTEPVPPRIWSSYIVITAGHAPSSWEEGPQNSIRPSCAPHRHCVRPHKHSSGHLEPDTAIPSIHTPHRHRVKPHTAIASRRTSTPPTSCFVVLMLEHRMTRCCFRMSLEHLIADHEDRLVRLKRERTPRTG